MRESSARRPVTHLQIPRFPAQNQLENRFRNKEAGSLTYYLPQNLPLINSSWIKCLNISSIKNTYSHTPCTDISFNNGPRIQLWSPKVIMNLRNSYPRPCPPTSEHSPSLTGRWWCWCNHAHCAAARIKS